MPDYMMTIGGASVGAADTFPVINPATEEVVAHAPNATRQDVDRAMEAARLAFGAWARDPQARREVLTEAAVALDAIIEDLVPVLTAEQGKTLDDARFEAALPGRWLRHFIALGAPEEEVLQDDEIAISVLKRAPIGVVAGITPWNFPIYQVIEKLAPALMAGNTVVVKPSPYTPLTTLMMGEALRGVLPPGVVNIVSGSDAVGEWMTTHPVPRKVAFTGSVATGRRVAAAVASDLKLVTLELGGNDPAIVLDDADVELIAPKILWTAFGNCGQICNAIKRVYAPAERYDSLVEALAEQARGIVVGRGTDDGVHLGPLNNRPQWERVIELTRDAIASGATAVTGGEPLPGPGYFFAPTVLREISDGVRVVDEEQFGPVLPVIRYETVDDAISRANATHFGLSASVWSGDEDRAIAVADLLEAGTVGINSHMIGGERICYGGVKWSGIGVVNGREGLLGYTVPRVVNRARAWQGVELPAALEATGAEAA
ncbi:MAG TPA: aldehyde dehydrogenase family protein [Solirubrobacteraceae bacterium]|nr:aldehyde dehydrogenase family protein [Solirubrobacteraceae bacterium]